jgi:hypothetical protein
MRASKPMSILLSLRVLRMVTVYRTGRQGSI